MTVDTKCKLQLKENGKITWIADLSELEEDQIQDVLNEIDETIGNILEDWSYLTDLENMRNDLLNLELYAQTVMKTKVFIKTTYVIDVIGRSISNVWPWRLWNDRNIPL